MVVTDGEDDKEDELDDDEKLPCEGDDVGGSGIKKLLEQSATLIQKATKGSKNNSTVIEETRYRISLMFSRYFKNILICTRQLGEKALLKETN